MLMKVFERYFSRNPVSRQLSFEADTAVIVIIPVFNDPDIFSFSEQFQKQQSSCYR